MLINENFTVKWTGQNQKHYKSKGFIFTKYKDEITVETKDLHPTCKFQIRYICDECGEIKTSTYQNYYIKLLKNKSEKDICVKCSNTIRNKSHKVNNPYSLHQWAVDNSRNDIIDRWDYELNNGIDIKSLYYKENINCYFQCSNSIHESELFSIVHITRTNNSNKIKCRKCNSFEQWCIDNGRNDLLTRYDYELNEIAPDSFGHSSKRSIYLKCENGLHESQKYSVQRITNKEILLKCECEICNSFGFFLEKSNILHLWDYDNNKINPYDISRCSNRKVFMLCENNKHSSYSVSLSNYVVNDSKCPSCSRERTESYLQEKTRLYLNELGYDVKHEYDCSLICINPQTNKRLLYDNEFIVKNDDTYYSVICEVNGTQHYNLSAYNGIWNDSKTMPEERLEYQRWKDKYKYKHAIKCGYEFLTIPFWAEKDDLYKQIINNKIQEILSKQ